METGQGGLLRKSSQIFKPIQGKEDFYEKELGCKGRSRR